MSDKRAFADSVKSLFSEAITAKQLEAHLSMMGHLPIRFKIWSQAVYLSENVDGFLSVLPSGAKSHHLLKDDGAIIRIVESARSDNKSDIRGFVALLPSSTSNIYRVVCISDSLFWTKAASRFVTRSYPYLVPIFFRQLELRQILLEFERSISSSFDLIARDMTLKGRRAYFKRVYKRSDEFDSERRWTESPIGKAFDDAQQRREWFKSMNLDIRLHGKSQVVATMRVTKHGLIAQEDLYEYSLQYLFPLLDNIAFSKTTLFSHRGLRERDYRPAKPVSIEYSDDVFHDKANVRKLTSVLRSYPNSSKAVYHGNPYLHVSLADFSDGSSFEVWVLSPRRIIVTPQAKTSVPSFEKLVAYIFEQFREGEVKEYSNG